MRNKRGAFTLVELLVVIVIIGILASLLLPAIVHALHRARVANCMSNLRSLRDCQLVYLSGYGKGRFMVPATGGEFWLGLAKTPKPICDKPDLFNCPCCGDVAAAGTTSYRGPSTNPNKLDPRDPMGADKPDNHGRNGGGIVLLAGGDLVECDETEALWGECTSKLQD